MGGTNAQISGPQMLVTYCNVQGSFSGAGNINAEPLFDTTNYYLRINSPCIDKGDSSLIYNDPPDIGNPTLAAWPARGLVRNDMGAYGGPMSKVIANSVVSVNEVDSTLLPGKAELSQNYPNPFNPETVISYSLGSSSNVQLTVYDCLGRKLASLVNEVQPAGTYSVTFRNTDLPSGTYYYRLDAGGQSITRTMMLIK